MGGQDPDGDEFGGFGSSQAAAMSSSQLDNVDAAHAIQEAEESDEAKMHDYLCKLVNEKLTHHMVRRSVN